MRENALRGYSIKQFMEIEDKDFQKYIYASARIQIDRDVSRMEDEEKLAYYLNDKNIMCNAQGTFYIRCTTREYLVYDKQTKKVRLSAIHPHVYDRFKMDYFYDLDVIGKWMPKATKTFCKKVFEGKINTVADIIQYHKSYTIKNKNLSLATILKFMIGNDKYVLNVVEDAENLEKWDELNDVDIPGNLLALKPFKFKIKEIGTVNEKWANWMRIQSEKLNTFERLRNEEDGNCAGQKLELQASDGSHQISRF